MEKLKYFSIVLVVALCAGFTSCSDDDDDENGGSDSLVGVWQGESVDTSYRNGVMYDEDRESVRIELKGDGSYVYYDYEEEYGWDEGETGTWYQSGNKLVICEDGDEDDALELNIVDHRTIVHEENDSYEDPYSGNLYTYKEVMTLYKQ